MMTNSFGCFGHPLDESVMADIANHPEVRSRGVGEICKDIRNGAVEDTVSWSRTATRWSRRPDDYLTYGGGAGQRSPV